MGLPPTIEDSVVSDLLDHLNRQDLYRLLRLQIRGIEVNQAIQYYRADEHLTDPADRGPDNSLRFAARKAARVRVYVRSFFGSLSGVSGTLTVYRRRHYLYQESAVLNPESPGAVTAQSIVDYATERGDDSHTLNFIVPANVMQGDLRFKVTLDAPGGHTATKTIDVDARLLQTLSMRIVPVAYDGPGAGGNVSLPAPTLAQAQQTAGFSLLVYPVQATPSITMTSEVDLTFPLTGSPASPGGCAQSWINLNTLVAQAKTADGNLPGVFYYGLVPGGVPLGANSGCASGGVTSGMQGGGATMAHEFGHALGWKHAPCGNVGTTDPHPAYEPYDPPNNSNASIGEYGMNIDTGAIQSPVNGKDFMSYCSPRWISIYNHQRAIEHPRFNPTYIRDRPWFDWNEKAYDPWWWLKDRLPDPPPWDIRDDILINELEPLISVIGVRQAGGKLEVRSITRTQAARTLEGAERTAMRAELVGDQGEALAGATVYRLTGHGCGCGGDCGDEEDETFVFQAMIPDVDRGVGLRVTDDSKETLWEREASEKDLKGAQVEASVGSKGQLSVKWKLPRAERDCEVWIRWRKVRDTTTHVMKVARGSGSMRCPLSRFPAGEIMIDAVTHDGFSVVECKHVRVRIPAVPPTVAILSPVEHLTVEAGRTFRLQAVVTDQGGETRDEADCVWTINGKEVGRGLEAWVPAPKGGDHKLAVTLADKAGKARDETVFHSVNVERPE